MFLRSPCPKCREPIRLSAEKCPDCGYRPMKHERKRALWFAEFKLIFSCLVAGVLFYVARHG